MLGLLADVLSLALPVQLLLLACAVAALATTMPSLIARRHNPDRTTKVCARPRDCPPEGGGA